MFQLVDNIDKAVESKCRCTLTDKMGRCFHGTLTDSWVRMSGGKLRGKIKFTSDEKGEIELDCNDILEIRLDSPQKL